MFNRKKVRDLEALIEFLTNDYLANVREMKKEIAKKGKKIKALNKEINELKKKKK
jgi:hypothetical protein